MPPFTTRGRGTPTSRMAPANLAFRRLAISASAPLTSGTGPEPPPGSYVDDGLLLQRVLGRDEQDRDEPEEHRSEDREEGAGPLSKGSARRECDGHPVHHERPEREEHRRDVEHDEDQGEHVVLEVELDRRLALGELPALVREVLQGRWMGGPEQAGREERDQGEREGDE